ncbi:MAG: hypothetical protein ISN29_02085 [Gammaproteobacteria bacterium AqS3]|nr:hypothetical protein [Gammaproteobacteria bacterium AqS3]
MYERPSLYLARTIQKSLMTEPVVIRRRRQTRNRRGRIEETFTDLATKCSTEPLNRTDARIAALEVGGTRLLEPREFFTIERIEVNNRDEFLWNEKRYIAVETSDFGEYSETIAHRIEGQE